MTNSVHPYLVFLTLMIACQGYVPNPAASPPTTLLRLILGLPHVGSLITGPNLISCSL